LTFLGTQSGETPFTVWHKMLLIRWHITCCVIIQVDCLTMANANGFTPLHMAAQACHKYAMQTIDFVDISYICIMGK